MTTIYNTENNFKTNAPHNDTQAAEEVDNDVHWIKTSYMHASGVVEMSNGYTEAQDSTVLRLVTIKRYDDIRQAFETAAQSSLDNNEYHYDRDDDVLYLRLHNMDHFFYENLDKHISKISGARWRPYEEYFVITDTYPLPLNINSMPYSNYRESRKRVLNKVVKYLVCKPEQPILSNHKQPTEVFPDHVNHCVSVPRRKRCISSPTACEILDILRRKEMTQREVYEAIKCDYPDYKESNCKMALRNLTKRSYLSREKVFIGKSAKQRSTVFVYSISFDNQLNINAGN